AIYCARFEEADRAAARFVWARAIHSRRAISTGIAAHSQFVACNYDDAVRPAARGHPSAVYFVGAHRVLTAPGMAGNIEVGGCGRAPAGARAPPKISLA